jgi:hypothetical protein
MYYDVPYDTLRLIKKTILDKFKKQPAFRFRLLLRFRSLIAYLGKYEIRDKSYVAVEFAVPYEYINAYTLDMTLDV